MQCLRDPILGDVRLLLERHPTLNPDQKTRLMTGLTLVDDELARLRVLEAAVRENAEQGKGGKR